MFQVVTEGAMQLRAFTETNSALWEELGRMTGIGLQEPRLLADVQGTWTHPRGRVSMQAKEIRWDRATRPFPTIGEFAFDLELQRTEATAEMSASVEQQYLRGKATLPLGRGFWANLIRRRELPDWKEASGEFVVDNAQLASLARFAPNLLTPQGEADIHLSWDRGGLMGGQVKLRNAATRPLATLGPIRDINAMLLFAGREAILTNLSGDIGGQAVHVDGKVQLDERFLRTQEAPTFELRLQGTNIPLARQPSVLIRADLNLAIMNELGKKPIVLGTVKLRDSFFLSDLKDLTPGRVSAPQRRPPYFSVEAEPWAGWRLDLRAQGDRFLKVRSPLFNGEVSADLKVEGTLKEPIALGEARIHSGYVTFPFGTLTVQQGLVTVASDDPHRPKLYVVASSERLGYDVKMEVTGWADEPIVQFSSTPALSSEQIVLMLTTGQAPQGVSSTSTQQRAQGLAWFMGKNLLSELGFGGSGEDRLTIRSGEQVTEAGKPTYDVEYKLTDRWSVVGEYDRFSQYNAGLKWKVYSK
jgi:translocation and assembly module TamB